MKGHLIQNVDQLSLRQQGTYYKGNGYHQYNILAITNTFVSHHILFATKGVVHIFLEGDVLKEKIVKTQGVSMIMFLLAGTKATCLTLFHNQIRPVIYKHYLFFYWLTIWYVVKVSVCTSSIGCFHSHKRRSYFYLE